MAQAISAEGAAVILDEDLVHYDAGGAQRTVCATPPDIEKLRRTDPAAAARWRPALRSALGSSLADGYRISGFTRAGWYLLEKPA